MRKITAGGLTAKQYTAQQRRVFSNTFGRSLSYYWNVWLGFDVVKFNDDLGIPDNVSVADYLVDNYGQDIHDLVLELNSM